MLKFKERLAEKVSDDIVWLITRGEIPQHNVLMAGGQDEEIFWNAYIKRIDPQEKKYIEVIKKLLKRNYQEVFDNVEKYPDNTDKWTFNRKYWVREYAEAESKFITKLVEKEGQQALDYALSLAKKQYKVNIDILFDILNPEVIAALLKQTKRFSGSLVDTTEEAIRAAIATGLEAGESIPKLAVRVHKLLGIDSIGNRAEKIARSETIYASNAGAEFGYMQSGIVEGKEWLAAIDERTCESCNAMNGRKELLGKSFDVSDIDLNFDYSNGQMPHPPLHTNCRCVIVPIVEEA